MAYLKFAHLCYRAYRGDLDAAWEVIAILKDRFDIGHPPGDGPVLGPRP